MPARLGYRADKPTQALSKFAVELRYEDIPSIVIENMKLHILDTLGCGLLGAEDPRNSAPVEVARQLGGTPASSVWGSEVMTSPTEAALINGTFARSFEFDDHCQDIGVHPGACVVPSVLGFAEYLGGTSGVEFLTSCVAGYEIGVRVGLATGLEPMKRGWDSAGFNGALAAAAALGRLWKFDQTKMMHALGLAATQGAGLMSVQYGSDALGMNSGKAAQSGVYAAMLANLGFRGVADVLELPFGGYLSTLGENYEFERITEDLGTRYMALEKIALKAYPGASWTHASLEAVEEIEARNHVQAEDVSRIVVRQTSLGLDHVGWDYKPEGITSALCNIAFAISLFLVRGSNHPGLYNVSSLWDPDILGLCKRISVELDEQLERTDPDSIAAAVRLETKRGEILTARVDNPKGAAGTRPLTKEAVERKFRNNVEDPEFADVVTDITYGIEALRDCRRLGAVLRRNRVGPAQKIPETTSA
jgi:aconitate decarboxylase